MIDPADKRVVRVIGDVRREIAAQISEHERAIRYLKGKDELLIGIQGMLTIQEEETPVVGKGSRPNMSAVRPATSGLAETVDTIFEKARKEGQ